MLYGQELGTGEDVVRERRDRCRSTAAMHQLCSVPGTYEGFAVNFIRSPYGWVLGSKCIQTI